MYNTHTFLKMLKYPYLYYTHNDIIIIVLNGCTLNVIKLDEI